MEKIACKECGDLSFFLRVKGPQTGIYCASCGKWNKWINKKDLAVLKRQGMKVHPEDYNPELVSEIIEKAQKSVNERNVENLGVIEEEEYTPSPSPSSLSNRKLTQDELHSFGEVVYEDEEPCGVCASGSLEALNPVDDIVASVFQDIIFVRSKDNSKMYGSFRAQYCPGCGKPLS
jgi:hypothetical protein